MRRELHNCAYEAHIDILYLALARFPSLHTALWNLAIKNIFAWFFLIQLLRIFPEHFDIVLNIRNYIYGSLGKHIGYLANSQKKRKLVLVKIRFFYAYNIFKILLL